MVSPDFQQRGEGERGGEGGRRRQRKASLTNKEGCSKEMTGRDNVSPHLS